MNLPTFQNILGRFAVGAIGWTFDQTAISWLLAMRQELGTSRGQFVMLLKLPRKTGRLRLLLATGLIYASNVLVGTGSLYAGDLGSNTSQPLNISTRLRVLTDDNVLIGGFIINGTDPKKVILRALGPSLNALGVPGALQDPTLELHDNTGAIIAFDDDWRDSQAVEIQATGIPPGDARESAIVRSLSPGAYTAVVKGKSGTTGIGVIEVYDLDPSANSKLANISTRGVVDTDDNVMIGGFIIGGGSGQTKVLIRGVGFSLSEFGITNSLNDPTLELHDGNGTQIASNDNWKETDRGLIEATGIQPSDFFEPSIVSLFSPGNYTAIVRGKSNTTGVALVEAYDLGAAPLVAAPRVQATSGLGTSFEVSTVGVGLTYQWQRLPRGGGSWVNIADGSAYSGTTTSKLTLSEMTTALSGDQFRVVVTNPAGAATSGPETFVADSLLKDATSFAATYPPLATVTYPTKAGDTLTIAAYPGFVHLIVNPGTPEAAVTNAVSTNGGGIVAKTPLLGLYLIQLAPGNEFAFLNALYANSFVIDGTPASPAVPGGCMLAVDYFSRDPGGDPDPCHQLHGPIVENILKRSGGCVDELDLTTINGSTKAADSFDISQAILRKIELANTSGDPVVINMSLQSWASGRVQSINRTDCSDPQCRAIRHQQILFYYSQLQAIESAALARPDRSVNAIVVMIAGNAGVDLDNELTALQNRFPNAFKTVRVVGGVNSGGQILTDFNHLSNNTSNLMAYARGNNVQEGANVCSGTSFAGPEVARVLDYIRSHSPGATAAQILSAFDQTLRDLAAANILPQDQSGLTTQAFLDHAVDLIVQAAWNGTWVGTYSDNTHPNCSYHNAGPITINPSVTNGAVSGSANLGGIEVRYLSDCSVAGYDTSAGSISGSVSGPTMNFTFSGVDDTGPLTGTSTTFVVVGTRNGNTISGSFAFPHSTGSGTVILHKQ